MLIYWIAWMCWGKNANSLAYGMLWSDLAFVYKFMFFQGTGLTQPSEVLEGSKSAVLSETVYQSHKGYSSPASMEMDLLDIDSLATDECGVEITGKTHVLVFHV